MPMFDLSLSELREYRPEVDQPADFDEFWRQTLADAEQFDLAPSFVPYDAGLTTVDVYDAAFSGFGGDRIAGWFIVPHGATGPLPCVVTYLGYGDGRGLPYDWLLWPSAGYAFFVMDTRGQGAVNRRAGSTADPAGTGHPHVPGFLTRGLLDPADHYYRRVFTDAVRAVAAVRSHPVVDPAKIIVNGASQGGAITVATAALVPDVAGAIAGVPFLCHFRRAVEITDRNPYQELISYFRVQRDHVEQAFRTLSYFDGVNLAARATAPAVFTVGLMDQTCPPSTVFAAYNRWAGEPKEIEVWPYNEHEGGGVFTDANALRWVRQLLG